MRLINRSYSIIRSIKRFSTSSSTNDVIVEHQDSITLIGINNPEKRNALTINIINKLKASFEEFDNSDAKVAILYGERGCFSSGFDIDEVTKLGYPIFEEAVEKWKTGPLCKKPIVCSLSGFAVAEGLELALACDLRVIEETACLGYLGRRFGVPFSFSGGRRLAALVGHSRALDLALTGRKISGCVAHSWGLAARHVATGSALGQSISLALCVSKFPSNAMVHDKLEILKSLQEFNPGDHDAYASDMKNEKTMAIKIMPEYLNKFSEGVGKHGLTKNIIKRTLPHWESEEVDDVEEEHKLV